MALSHLQAALESLDAKIAEAMTNPRPSYSIEGQSVSWSEYRKSLLEERERLRGLILAEEGPYEANLQGW